MAAKKSETLDFTRHYLRDKPDASFAEIRDAAAKRDLKIYAIVFGRAKALEGLVKVAPYGSKKKLREQAEAAKQAKLKAEESAASDVGAVDIATPLDKIDAMIQGVRDNHHDLERYRAALIRISEILDKVL